MGDRSYLEITLRRSDLAQAAQCDFKWSEPCGDKVDTQESLVRIEIYEANWAMEDERETLAQLGVPFHGMHGSGSNYDAGAFVALNGTMREVGLRSCDNTLVVTCDWRTGEPYPEDLANLKAYLAMQQQVEALFAPLQPTEEV